MQPVEDGEEKYASDQPGSVHYRLIVASGGICEICGREFESRCMRIHVLEGRFRDAQAGILVLCAGCHCQLLETGVPPELLKVIVAERPLQLRQLYRKILGQPPPTLHVRSEPDMEELYRTACGSWSLNGSG